MQAFCLLVLAGAALRTYCGGSAAAAAAASAPLCLPRGSALLALLSPPQLTDALAAAGPLLTWLPLLYASCGRAPAHAATRRALLLCMAAWLLLSWPMRLTKRLHAALLQGAAPPFDPSGHIFLYGMQLVPLLAFKQEGVAAGGAAPPAKPPLQLRLRQLPGLLLARGWETLLLHLAFCTAAFYHDALESAAAAGCVLAVHAAASAAPLRSLAGAQPLQLLGAAGGAWALAGWGLLRMLAAAGAAAPRRLHWHALHDVAVLAVGLASASGGAPAGPGSASASASAGAT